MTKLKLLPILPYIIFFLTALTPLLWISNIGNKQMLGAGDYISPYKVRSDFNNLFSIYDKTQFGGIDASIWLGSIFPFWTAMLITKWLNGSAAIGTLIYISSLFFFSQSLMFLWLKYYLHQYRINNIICILGAITYGFSPYFPFYITPGQIHNYLIFAFFPGIMILFDIFFRHQKLAKKYYLLLFIIMSIFVGGASWGVGPLYVVMITCLLYALILLIQDFSKFILIFRRLSEIILILITANIYWILPWIFSGLSETQTFSIASINSYIDVATQFASIPNIFLGRAGGIYYQRLTEPFLSIISSEFFLILLGFILGLFLIRNSKFILVSGMTLLSIFIIKGPQPPFGGIFLWIYNHIPGFMTFRRPVNKFSGVFLLFFITAGINGLITLTNTFPKYQKIIRILITLVLGIGAIALIGLTLNANTLTPFNIPDYYQHAWKYLSQDSVSRVIVLPGLSGIEPSFNRNLNNYSGFDPLYKIWDTSILFPDYTDYSPDNALKHQINALILKMLKHEDICTNVLESGVSHILIREDLSANANFELPPAEYLADTNSSKIWIDRKYFGPKGTGIYIFSLNPECRSPRIGVYNKNTILPAQVTEISRTKYLIKIKSEINPTDLRFLDNFSRWWILFPGDLSKNTWVQDMILIIPGLFKSHHEIIYGWTNNWKLTGSANKSVFTLYYLPQSAAYLGILIWIIIFIFLIILVFKLIKI